MPKQIFNFTVAKISGITIFFLTIAAANFIPQSIEAGFPKNTDNISVLNWQGETTSSVKSPGKLMETDGLVHMNPVGDALDPPGSRRMPWRTEAEKNLAATEGYIGGDGMQLMNGFDQCFSNPNVIVAGQDMGGNWLSVDGGRSWWKPIQRGLVTSHIDQVGIDPNNPSRWVNACFEGYASHFASAGLYISEDWGRTNQKVHSLPNTAVQGNKWPKRCIIGMPSSPVVDGKTQRWYAIVDPATENAGGSFQFLRSTNGGITWTQVITLPKSIYGSIMRHSEPHPTNQDIFFFVSTSGVWRVTNAGGTPVVSRLDGQGGISSGGGYRIFCGFEGSTPVLILNRSNGIYKSQNSGADLGSTWSKIDSYVPVELNVNRMNLEAMIDLRHTGDSPPGFARVKRLGLPWQDLARPDIADRPGLQDARGRFDRSSAVFYLSSTEVFVAAYATHAIHLWQRSDSLGKPGTWQISNDYLSGFQSENGWRHAQQFHRTDPQKFCMGFIDGGLMPTEDGGRSYIKLGESGGSIARMRKGSPYPSGIHSTVFASAMHPDFDTHPIAIACIDRSNNGYAIISESGNNDDWRSPENAEMASFNGRVPFIGFDFGNPKYAYWARWRSNDHGRVNSWSRMDWLHSGGYEIIGMTRTMDADFQAVFAWDRAGTRNKIARSLDGGDTWSVIIDFTNWNYQPLGYPGNSHKGIFFVHPSNPDRIWLAGSKFETGDFRGQGRYRCREVREVRLDEGTVNNRPFNVINLSPQNILDDLTPGTDFYANSFEIDPRYLNVMYATNLNTGSGVSLIRSVDSGLTWENLTGLVPDIMMTGNGVHPLTGDFFQSTSNGMFILPPPYEQTDPAPLFEIHSVASRVLGDDDPIPTAIILSTSTTSAMCGKDGSASVSPGGGTPPYSFRWSDNQTTQTATELSAGVYNVKVTDNNSYTAYESVTVPGPPTLALTLSQSADILSATPVGGSPPYSYLWSPGGETTMQITNASGGTLYSVTVSDANNCTINKSIMAEGSSGTLTASIPGAYLSICPNPYRDKTIVNYTIERTMNVRIDLYSIIGMRVATLIDEKHEPGSYSHPWRGSSKGITSGSYIVRMRFGDTGYVTRRIVQIY